MKKFIVVIALIIFWNSNSYAGPVKLSLSCEGKSVARTIGLFTDDRETSNMYEDYTFWLKGENIFMISIDHSSHHYGKDQIYINNKIREDTDEHPPFTMGSSGKTLSWTLPYYKGGSITRNNYKHRISLQNGTVSGSLDGSYINDSGSEIAKYYIDFNLRCNGAKKILASIGEGGNIPNIPDNEVIPASSGTGFFISKNGNLVTNHHVIEGCSKVKVFYNEKPHDARLLAVDKINDLAILNINKKVKQYYFIADKDPELLENVIVAGFPLGKKVSSSIKTSKGSITALSGYGDNYSEFQTDAALNSGNSGGPIINESGEVLGVAVAAYGKKQGVESFNFGIKNSTLKTFAQANKIKVETSSIFNLMQPNIKSLINNGTTYIECWMRGASLKKMMMKKNSRKAFYSKFK